MIRTVPKRRCSQRKQKFSLHPGPQDSKTFQRVKFTWTEIKFVVSFIAEKNISAVSLNNSTLHLDAAKCEAENERNLRVEIDLISNALHKERISKKCCSHVLCSPVPESVGAKQCNLCQAKEPGPARQTCVRNGKQRRSKKQKCLKIGEFTAWQIREKFNAKLYVRGKKISNSFVNACYIP